MTDRGNTMNGEMYQICCIVAAAKKALQDGTDISYTPSEYVFRTEFSFLPEKEPFIQKVFTAYNVEDWFEHCKQKKLLDIKFLAPVSVSDRKVLGFTNTSQSSIVCFYEGGKVTYFTARWEFDPTRKWTVWYTENEWPDPPSGKPDFEDHTEDFSGVLEKIKELALQLGFEYFAQVFQDAWDLLNDRKEVTNVDKLALPPQSLPAKDKQMFAAASKADVFGAMGSWNDGPPYMAHEKGLDAEYDQLSAELLKNIRLAVLYAVNEW